ncbi:MAG: DHA2 family efflux MFS transporter permease subunit [Chloroflexi bacterium]|nr:DHA2 family efflux MFS transporter permease subunit [Ktedonobacteraceae bacterium]MBV9019743.1 DHA2 family efflux MFS transporter permease subunit [Ktedonobacteraceae bacterium]MBV9708088.1 DHA2 family efflux MFS transporter permease subunit [Chloroflexota bacterium]
MVNGQAIKRSAGLEYKWVVTFVVVFGVFMSILDQTIVNIAIPRLQTAFGADIHSVQWVLTAYILTLGIVTPSSGFFADKFGTKRVYMFSLSAFTIGSALCGLAWNLPVLIFFRILQAAGGAALFPLSITMLFREFPPEERGIAVGIFGIPALLAPAIGPTLGGYLVTYVSWQSIFYVNVPIGIVAVLLVSLLIREYPTQDNLRFDFLGFLLVAVGLGMLLYGLSTASTDGWGSTTVIGTISAGIAGLIIFTVVELLLVNRGDQPLLDVRLFGNGPFLTSSIASIFVFVSLYGGIFLLPIYLQTIRTQSAFQAGVTLLPQALASMLGVVVGGRLVDRIGVRAVIIPGLLILGIGTWQLSFITVTSPLWWLQLIFIIRGLGLGLGIMPLTITALSEVPPRQLAQASSINTVIRSAGGSLSIAILATLVQTQAKVHFTHLAEQVTTTSPLGHLLLGLQAVLVSRGADINAARVAGLQVIVGLVQQQAFVLALQDAFIFSLVVTVFAIIAILFVRQSRQPARAPQSSADGQETVSEQEAHPVLVFAE